MTHPLPSDDAWAAYQVARRDATDELLRWQGAKAAADAASAAQSAAWAAYVAADTEAEALWAAWMDAAGITPAPSPVPVEE